MQSFVDIEVSKHLKKENQILKLNELLDWSKLEKILGPVHSKDGPTGYPPLSMFKCLLLAAWHNLSAPSLEESLTVRLDFLKFSGFSLGDHLPDETTFCRFRNRLIEQNKFDALFKEVNHQLETYGLKVKSASVAIVDATIIESNARPRKVLDEESETVQYSSDPDAKWLKKGKKSYFGYRAFARTDKEGFIDQTHVTPANAAETKELDKMTQNLPQGVRVQADKGFSSYENRQMLRSKRLKSGLMYKAFRGRVLTGKETLFNKLISKVRFRIEQSFGTLRRRFNYRRARYMTLVKVNAEFLMKAMCLNMLKAINKVSYI